MSASLKPLTLEEFLDWERSQDQRFEFDGIQPVAMTGGSRAHSLIATRLAAALVFQVKPPCEAHGPELKVITTGRVRYPDASVVCNYSDAGDDTVAPTAILKNSFMEPPRQTHTLETNAPAAGAGALAGVRRR